MNIKKNKRYDNGLFKFGNGWYLFNNRYGDKYQITKFDNDKKWSISEHKTGKGFNWTTVAKSSTLTDAIEKCKVGLVGLKF